MTAFFEFCHILKVFLKVLNLLLYSSARYTFPLLREEGDVLFLEVTLVVNIISSTQQTLIRLLLCSRHLCGTMGETE